MVRASIGSSTTSSNKGSSSSGSSSLTTTTNHNALLTILRACALSMASLYVGFYLGYKEGISQTSRLCLSNQQQQQAQQHSQPQQEILDQPSTTTTTATATTPPPPQLPLFPKSTKSFVTGMSFVDRTEFATTFDTGIPLWDSGEHNNQVLLLHASHAMPSKETKANNSTHNILSVQDATQNCNYMSLILTEPNRNDQCIAIMGQYNSYHVTKFMRIKRTPPRGQIQLDRNQPLQWVKRGTDIRPFQTQTPSLKSTTNFWNQTLQPYLTSLDIYLEELKPLAEQVQTSNTIIVMVTNYGQSELLMNFVCNAISKNLDISMILVFATDLESYQLSKNLGLQTYYNSKLFQGIPKKHASRFGDSTYKQTIFSKLYCVHLIGLLGYNYLFQDIDLIWYKHPLDYFTGLAKTEASKQEFDMYMQNDGNYAQFYMPYSGNTGFYYVKNNPITQYFMNHFLVSGDLILSTSTHQAPFLSIMSEHASLHGLKVKILPQDDFPGGSHYQRKPLYMKYLLKAVRIPPALQNKIDPWIFHMSWTLNKDNKIKYFQQMGEWHVQPQCMPGGSYNTSKHTTTIATDEGGGGGGEEEQRESIVNDIKQPCCSYKPIIECHFRDTPSIIDCRDSPPSEKDKPKPSWYPQRA